MAKSKFTRQNLRTDILKQVLFRVDFTGSTGGQETEQFVVKLKDDWANYFHRYNKITNKNFKIDINKDGMVRHEQLLQTIHRFSLSQIGQSEAIMDISDDFATLTINISENYEGSDNYLRCFSNLIHRILVSDQFINLKRIGIRKFDHIFISEKANIDDILEEHLWANYSDMGSCLKKEYKDYISTNGTSVNICRSVERVKVNNVDKIRLIFDVDAYREENYLQRSELRTEDVIYDMMQSQLNAHLFNLFIATFREAYINQFYHE